MRVEGQLVFNNTRPIVQSALRGEEPVACVAGDGLGREALMRFCQENFSAWQVPRDVWLVGEIPSTERGKVKVLVSMFGRETPVELDFLQIKKI